MIGNKNKKFIVLGGLLLLLAGVSALHYLSDRVLLKQAFTAAGFFDQGTPDHLTGKYTTIVDEQGNNVCFLARVAAAGDELYTSEGRHYRVERVQGERAEAKFMGMDEQILAYNEFYAGLSVAVLKDLAEKNNSTFAVYHTHTDESYVPTDGSESIPFKGGIYQVGKSMVDKLQDKNCQVKYDETPHDPHDNNAYTRSRRTAVSLMKAKPAAIFDVHRDGVPDASYYRATINGKQVARLRLVVGRENPKMSANMDFAKKMMASANNLYPKVVKEIFVGKGDYNQDLMSTALLLEAGTHTNSREEAANGVAMFSEAIPVVLGISPSPAAPAAPTTQKPAGTTGGAWKALGWILGLTLIVGLGFLLVSSGNLANAKKRLAGFGREFSSFFGPRPVARKPAAHEPHAVHKKAAAEDDQATKEALEKQKDDLNKD